MVDGWWMMVGRWWWLVGGGWSVADGSRLIVVEKRSREALRPGSLLPTNC
jgi:hypothetical protein